MVDYVSILAKIHEQKQMSVGFSSLTTILTCRLTFQTTQLKSLIEFLFKKIFNNQLRIILSVLYKRVKHWLCIERRATATRGRTKTLFLLFAVFRFSRNPKFSLFAVFHFGTISRKTFFVKNFFRKKLFRENCENEKLFSRKRKTFFYTFNSPQVAT